MTSLQEGLQLSNSGVVCFVGAGGKTSLMFRLGRELSEGGASVLTTTTTKIWMPTPDQSKEVVISPLAEAIAGRAAQFRTNNFHLTAAAEKLTSENKLKGYAPEFIDELWNRGQFNWILVEADGAAGRSLKAPAGHEPVIPACTQWVIGMVGLDAVGKTLDEQSVFRSGIFADLTGLALGRTVSAAAVAVSLTHVNGIFKGSPKAADYYIFLNKAECVGGIQTGRKIVTMIKEINKTRIRRILIGSVLKNPPVIECHEMQAGKRGDW